LLEYQSIYIFIMFNTQCLCWICMEKINNPRKLFYNWMAFDRFDWIILY